MRTSFTGVLCAFLIASSPSAFSDSCDATTKPVHLSGVFCAELDPPYLRCALPTDVQGGLKQANLNVVQQAADIFAWQDFIALNWPALDGQRGLLGFQLQAIDFRLRNAFGIPSQRILGPLQFRIGHFAHVRAPVPHNTEQRRQIPCDRW